MYTEFVSSYIQPADVHAPKRHWSLIAVLFDGGPSDPDNKTPNSLAIGRWDNKPALAVRWNGNADNPLGNPQSRGLPTWFIVPEQHWKQILETEHYRFSTDKISFAREFLRSRAVYFLSRCPNPACREFQQLVLHTYRASELQNTIETLKRGELRLYHIICDHSWKPSERDEDALAATLSAAWESYRLDTKRDSPTEL